MTHDQRTFTIRAMRAYGGSFVKALSEAYERADANNSARIEQAFPDYIQKYGPGSAFYKEAATS